MKRTLLALSLVTVAMTANAAVGVSVSIGEPGFYGQIDIGDMPRPEVIYPQPVLIERVPVGVVSEPLYLRVPPEQSRDWRRYCGGYHACGRPVYFVQDRWYREQYVPRYHERHYNDDRHEHHDHRDHEDHDHQGHDHDDHDHDHRDHDRHDDH